jgi:predicted Zn-dependent protease
MQPSAKARLALLLSTVVWVGVPSLGWTENAKDRVVEEEIDHLAIAATLIRDGNHERAEGVLGQVDVEQPGLNLPRYYTLLGLAQLEQGHHLPAIRSLKMAIARGQTDPVVHSYHAQALFALKRWDGVLDALRKAGAAGRGAPALFLMRARAHWELRDRGAAMKALSEGEAAFPGNADIQRAKLTYLVELGLFQEVARLGATYLRRSGATAEDLAMVAEGLRRSKQLDQATGVLEAARLRFPAETKLTVLLAHTYLDAGHPLAAAMLMEDASRSDSSLALDAAELYQRAGRIHQALALNARVGDQKAKVKQRLSILIELERYEEVAAMDSRLARLGLLADENIRYALAYACYKTGQLDAAEAQLKHIKDVKLFQKTLELRRAMQACREAGWECP